MFNKKLTYKSEKSKEDLERTLQKIVDRKTEDNFKSVFSQIFWHANDEIVGVVNKDGVKFWRSWSPGNFDVFYVVFNCKTSKIKQTTILKIHSEFNPIGKIFSTITIVISIMWIAKTIYDIFYNNGTGINLIAVLVFTAGINCIALFSFISYNNQTIEELERVCKLTKVVLRKVKRTENE